MKSILDPTFEYTPSAKTDLKKTFARIRREQKALSPATPRVHPRSLSPEQPVDLFRQRRAVG